MASAARHTAINSASLEDPVAAALGRRLLDVRRRVGLDQVAARGPAEQPLGVRQHAVGHHGRAAVGDALDQRQDVGLAHRRDRLAAQHRQHLAPHDPLHLGTAAVVALVPDQPHLDYVSHRP